MTLDDYLNPSCPHCDNDARLQFYPMLGGTVYGQCPCGFGWELPKLKKELVN